MEFSKAVAELQKFCGTDLTSTLAQIEASVQGVTAETCSAAVASWVAGLMAPGIDGTEPAVQHRMQPTALGVSVKRRG